MMAGQNIRKLALLAGIVIINACAPLAGPVIPPTLESSSLDTIIAQTANAAATQTALVAPPTSTPTPTQTNTPTQTSTATPTFIFILASLTPTRPTNTPGLVGTSYSCDIQSKTPADNSEFTRGIPFMARWQVRNNGSSSWSSGSADYFYSSGDRLHVQPLYDFPKSVAPGDSVDIIVEMIAPGEAGTYSTTWKITIGRSEFCTMGLTIIVK